MKAIILAAGYATRLYPLTLNKPKALLAINGKPMLDYICDEIETLEQVDEIIVASNHKFIRHFTNWANKRAGKRPVKILDDGSTCEEDRLGAIGDIHFVLHRENIKEDVLILAGDNFFTYRLTDYFDFFQKVRKDCIIVHELENPSELSRMGVAIIDEQSKVIELVEKPDVPSSNTAVYASYFYLKETLPLFDVYLSEGNKPDSPGLFPAWLYKRKDVYAFSFDGECYDIGTHEALAEVRRKFRLRVKK